ncbi:type I restriction endonuclease subunit R [Pontibacter qinzhouensis]|uniref:Type I restriction enzyme endonuclease subunit n=1 Tax=Pontibacter qinzhouensis TaxID=2603253 RepID=A0A5C8KCW3_9BACT|nr:type I restriction endonuclease subunit R [Pontibacter qinzhouensis]TXK52140.1 type I restriction endonuclease subunit R [Pontibacter qinzhouensis]
MSQYLAEEAIEQAAIAWLREQEPYTYQHGSEIKRDLSKAVLEDVFEDFLQRRYPQVPQKVLAELKQEFLYNSGADLHQRNHAFHLKLSKGISKSWKDDTGRQHFGHFYPIDYEDVHQNEFLVVNQFTIIGKSKRIPDLIIFVNGLPLVLFEFKNLFNQDATVEAAYNQVQHYTYQIPQLFEYNALTVVSDGQTTLHGMYSSGLEWFAAWKSIDGREVVNNGFALETLIKGLLVPERLLAYVRHYIFHELDKGQLVKKGAKYHQFFGIQYALQETLKSVRPYGDGRIGVVWHTTRSGKSITMAIYTGILRQLPELKNPTIVVQVDRFDLNRQLFDDFVAAKDLVGDVQIANTTDELRALLSGDGGGVVFSTVQKFNLKDNASGRELEHPVLSTRDNIIVIADECHRTQYGLVQGFANNLRRALPQASFIGFTGTPVDSKDADTVAVFGDIIHTYDIRQATEDKAVVPIYYEPRLAKLHLGNAQLEEEAEEITGGLEESDKNKILWTAMEDAAGAKERVEAIARDILQHYISRAEKGASIEGKAMIVCMSRRNCVKLYDALTALEGCPEVAIIMTTNIAKDPYTWHPHVRGKEQMEAVKARFKDPNDPLKLVIVRDMWLTGFDNPAMHTLYVDKVMSGHNLIQAVNRVATVFRDKPNGLIVDYIGIGDKLREATKKYTSAGGEGKVAFDMEEAFELARETVNLLRAMLPGGCSYSNWPAMNAEERRELALTVLNHMVADDDRSNRFLLNEKKLSSLVPIVKSHATIQEIANDYIFFQNIGVIVRKAKNPVSNIRKKEDQVKNLIHRSIGSDNVIDVFEMAGIERFDISIITDAFLATAKEKKSGNELKLELIRQLLNNEIKLRSSKNLVKYKKLKESLEKIIQDYHNNFFDNLVALEKLRQEVAKPLQEEDQRRNQLGLTDEEEAFYEILANHPNALQDFDLIKDLVQKILAEVKRSAQQPDWYKKEDTKAQLMLAVKKVLRFKVKAELQEILEEVMEQAEARYKQYNVHAA